MSSLSERKRNQLLSIGADLFFAVGSVQQSVLTEAQFQAELGSDWVLMDGRDITGSRLATLKGWTNLPDASGRFLRSSGGNADPNVGGLQDQGTAVNGLVLAGSSPTLSANSFAAASHSHTSGNMYAKVGPTISGSAIRSVQKGNQTFGGGIVTGANSNTNVFVGRGSDVDGFTSDSSNTALNISGGAYSLSSSNVETRPVNLTVNTFIKIN